MTATTLGDLLSLDQIIAGLAQDLIDLRTGKISVKDARARGDLAREIFRGVRLAVDAQRRIEGEAKVLPGPEEKHDDRR